MNHSIYPRGSLLRLACRCAAALVFTVAASAQVINTVNNNVGIGTHSPSMLLDIFGTNQRMRIGDGANMLIAGQWDSINNRIESVGRPLLLTTYTGAVSIGPSGNSVLTITSAGNVGIGTSTPSSLLHVQGGPIQINNASGNGGAVVKFLGSSTGRNFLIGNQQNVNDAFEITPSATNGGSTFSTPALVITGAGNVGIGTNTPASPLTVEGGFYTALVTSASTTGTGLNLENRNSGVRYQLQAMGNQYPARAGNFEIQNFNSGHVPFAIRNDGVLLSDSTVAVTASGSVGIGTTAPGRTLDVNGAARFGPYAEIRSSTPYLELQDTAAGGIYASFQSIGGRARFWVNGSEPFTIVGSGNVGLGTTAPLSKLHVMGVGRFGLNDASTNNIGGVLVASGTGVGGARQYWIGASDPTAHNNNNFEISDYNGTINSPLLTILGTHNGAAGGNVGIGTTNITHKLTVAGAVRATSFVADTNTYADFVFQPGYKVASLSEVEAAIQREGHLPGIPSETEAKRDGIDVAKLQVQLLQKVEELTLHLIAHEKEIAALKRQNADLQAQLTARARDQK